MATSQELLHPYIIKCDVRSKFLDIMRVCFSLPVECELISHAFDEAAAAHYGKKREGGEPVLEHLVASALILMQLLDVRDAELIATALLHDIVEDTRDAPLPWTVELVEEHFGKRIAYLLSFLSKLPVSLYSSVEERNAVYHHWFRFAPRPDFFLVKLAERMHNVLTLGSCSREKQERKIIETREYYLPYARLLGILPKELEEAIAVIIAENNLTFAAP